MKAVNMVRYRCLYYIVVAMMIILVPTSCTTKKSVANSPNIIIESVDIKRNRLDVEVEKWLGAPYKYGGQSLEGVDCSGLVVEIYKAVYGKKLYRSSYEIYEKNCYPIKKSELKEGDLVFFITSSKGGRINHVGLYMRDNKFIHSTTKRGVIISDLSENYYTKYFYKAGRVINR